MEIKPRPSAMEFVDGLVNNAIQDPKVWDAFDAIYDERFLVFDMVSAFYQHEAVRAKKLSPDNASAVFYRLRNMLTARSEGNDG